MKKTIAQQLEEAVTCALSTYNKSEFDKLDLEKLDLEKMIEHIKDVSLSIAYLCAIAAKSATGDLKEYLEEQTSSTKSLVFENYVNIQDIYEMMKTEEARECTVWTY